MMLSLDQYRDRVNSLFEANIVSVLKDDQWSDHQKAGTLILLTTSMLSSAAFFTASVTPHMKNAQPEAQIDDLINLLREILVDSKPISKRGLTLVNGVKP